MRCERCGVSIATSGLSCPGCGAALSESHMKGEERDYYTLFDLSPHMSFSEIRARLTQAARVYGGRANSAPQLEDRQQAERMLPILAEAEAILLHAPTRSSYDARWRDRQSPPTFASRGANPRSAGSPTSPEHEWQEPYNAPDAASAEPTWRPPTPASVPTVQGRRSGTPSVDGDAGIRTTWFGWTTVRGTIIHLDSIYAIPAPVSWIRILLVVIVAPVVVPLVLGLWLAALIIIPRFGRALDLTSPLLLFVAFCRTGNRSQVPVRDLRLRDDAGTEHGVRMTGQLVAGSVNVGDEVTLSGFSFRGTLKVWRGINHRTRSQIRVRA
jgi:hypothetical protein